VNVTFFLFVFRLFGTQNSDAGESPKRQNTTICNMFFPFIVECDFQKRHEINKIISVLKVLRKILGLKREGATERRRRLQNEVICTAHGK